MNDSTEDDAAGGDEHDFGRDEPTTVETERGAVRASERVFASVSGPLDAATDALERVEDALARIAPARRPAFLRALILRLRRMGDLFHDVARDHEALLRLEEQRKDDDP